MTYALLAALTIRMSVLLGVALVAGLLLRRKSAALRHAVLATAVSGSLAVPLLSTALPQWHVAIPTRPLLLTSKPLGADRVVVTSEVAMEGRGGELLSQAESAPLPVSRGATSILGWVWAAGAALSLLLLVVGLVRLIVLTRWAHSIDAGSWHDELCRLQRGGRLRRVTLLQTDGPSVLLTWGTLRPCIVLPRGAESWSASRIRFVLEHEAEHIRRGDWLLQIAAETLRALAWFNPLAWAAARRLRVESEHACDDAVLASGVAPTEYAEQLVHVARLLAAPRVAIPAPAMARSSSLERRVSAMLDSGIPRNPLTRTVNLAIVVIGLACTLSVSTLAQSKFATVSGTVRDQLGGTIPGVTLALTHTESGAKHEIKSNESGAFEFVGLPPGNYSLVVNAMGFQPLDATLQLAGGQTLQQQVRLELGTLQETITVRDGPPSQVRARQRSAGPDSPVACTAQPNSGRIKPPTKVEDKRPVYPATMANTNIEGRVNLEAVIGVDGTVRTMRTIDATNVDFEQSAMDAVRQWRFTPTLLTCVPTEVTMKVLVMFTPEAAAPPPPPPPPPTPAIPPTPPTPATPVR